MGLVSVQVALAGPPGEPGDMNATVPYIKVDVIDNDRIE
jgi:hypothetical protein